MPPQSGPDYLGFKQRAEATKLPVAVIRCLLMRLRIRSEKNFPQIAATAVPDSTPEPLVVNRLWHPWLAPGCPEASRALLTQCQVANDALWIQVWFLGGGDEKD